MISFSILLAICEKLLCLFVVYHNSETCRDNVIDDSVSVYRGGWRNVGVWCGRERGGVECWLYIHH